MLFSPIRTQIVCFLFLLFGFTALFAPSSVLKQVSQRKVAFLHLRCILCIFSQAMHHRTVGRLRRLIVLWRIFQALLETWKPKCSPQIVFMEIIPRLLAKFNSGKICADFLVGWLVSLELEFLGESLKNEDHQLEPVRPGFII